MAPNFLATFAPDYIDFQYCFTGALCGPCVIKLSSKIPSDV